MQGELREAIHNLVYEHLTDDDDVDIVVDQFMSLPQIAALQSENAEMLETIAMDHARMHGMMSAAPVGDDWKCICIYCEKARAALGAKQKEEEE